MNSDDQKYQFAYALIDLRSVYRLQQKDFASRLGISPQYVCDLESGRRMPSVSLVEKIDEKFGPLSKPSGFTLRWHRLGARAHGWRV